MQVNILLRLVQRLAGATSKVPRVEGFATQNTRWEEAHKFTGQCSIGRSVDNRTANAPVGNVNACLLVEVGT